MQPTTSEQPSIQALRALFEDVGYSAQDAELKAEMLEADDSAEATDRYHHGHRVSRLEGVKRVSEEVRRGQEELHRMQKEGVSSDPEVAAMEKGISNIMTRALDGMTGHGNDANGYEMRYGGKGRSDKRSMMERPIHRAMAVCAAQGNSNDEIAQKFGYTSQTVAKLRRQPWFISLVVEIQAIREMTVEQRLLAESQQALSNLVEMANGAKSENVRYQANVNLLDRAYGKPVQRVENFNASLSEVRDLKALDKEKEHLETQLRELEEQEKKLRGDNAD